MKNTIRAVVYMICILASYFSFTVLWSLLSEVDYIQCLRAPQQMYGLFFIYWWFPGIFVLEDISQILTIKNSNV
jgi:hypothetical protein